MAIFVKVVGDTAAEWQKAISRMPELGQGRILLDADQSVSKRYGMLKQPSSMHPGSQAGHTYVVVDPAGVIRYVKDDVSMGINNQDLIDQIAKLGP